MSTEQKTFTPGPWMVSEAYGNTIVESQDVAIARFMGTPEEIQANARLIAAAPQIYEALNGLLTYCQARNIVFEPGWGTICLERAITALGQADGK